MFLHFPGFELAGPARPLSAPTTLPLCKEGPPQERNFGNESLSVSMQRRLAVHLVLYSALSERDAPHQEGEAGDEAPPSLLSPWAWLGPLPISHQPSGRESVAHVFCACVRVVSARVCMAVCVLRAQCFPVHFSAETRGTLRAHGLGCFAKGAGPPHFAFPSNEKFLVVGTVSLGRHSAGSRPWEPWNPRTC